MVKQLRHSNNFRHAYPFPESCSLSFCLQTSPAQLFDLMNGEWLWFSAVERLQGLSCIYIGDIKEFSKSEILKL